MKILRGGLRFAKGLFEDIYLDEVLNKIGRERNPFSGYSLVAPIFAVMASGASIFPVDEEVLAGMTTFFMKPKLEAKNGSEKPMVEQFYEKYCI